MARYAVSGVTSDKEQAYLFDENVTRIWLRNQGISTFDLESLIPLSNLRELYLDNNELETLNLEPLAKHGGLQVLSLAENRLSSVDLAPLSRCKNLTWLSLSKNKLDTIDLSPLAGCESLENLYLGGNNFTSVNLKPLARCRSLTEIVLSSDINDSLDTIIDLTHLVPLKNLQKVGLYKLERVSLGLQAHQFKRVPQAVTQCLEKCRNVSIEDIVKSRIDLMGPRKGLESLEQEIDRIDSQHWL
ncbi:MAG: leucine-rich repeat domain-containing protein, partial [Candidatus Thorarchaeota archaeon]|nr:leucine-rich repeat domain-containing protein [Candidatus Thorarchaeota archaeon]